MGGIIETQILSQCQKTKWKLLIVGQPAVSGRIQTG